MASQRQVGRGPAPAEGLGAGGQAQAEGDQGGRVREPSRRLHRPAGGTEHGQDGRGGGRWLRPSFEN